jgi:hypothetical protein
MDGPVTRQSLHGIFHSRTAKRLIVALVLFSSFITALTTAIQLFIDYRRDLESIESAFALVETSYLESLTHSLWVVDAELIETQLAGLLRLPDVEYAAIRVDGEAQVVGRTTSVRKCVGGGVSHPLRVRRPRPGDRHP